MKQSAARTSEHVGAGHPDKFCDQVADAILDESLRLCGNNDAMRARVRIAIECLAKDNLLVVSGETKWPDEILPKLDITNLAWKVWKDVGYGTNHLELSVVNHIRSQSPDIGVGAGTGVDAGGAGDQGIMVGYATDETPEMMPLEWVLARDLCFALRDLRVNKKVSWLSSDDCKSQVTLNAAGKVTNVIIAAHHAEMDIGELRNEIFVRVIKPMLAKQSESGEVSFDATGRFRYGTVHGAINGTGKFTIGGPMGDAGVVGRKIVVDAYGPRVPVGGGAYSGKDPTKVDRSAAYMARQIAKTIVTHKVKGAKECMVQIAYGIGQVEPEMVTAITQTGEDLSAWVKDHFPKLSQGAIIERLSLRNPKGWSYSEAAAYGHYGRSQFPWETVAKNV